MADASTDPQLIDDQETWQQSQLEMLRAQEAAADAAAAESQPAIKRMGWLVFIASFFLILIQLALAWVGTAAAATAVGLIVTVICWVADVGISVILFFLTRKYRKSMREARILWDISLVIDAVPFIGDFPLDLIALVYAFIKSRSKTIQHIAAKAEQIAHTAGIASRI
ncbi:MAG TPA: hypothetical protein VG866_01580 [Candidatus Paceibacterota bacterium]|nr:hypothetical protein [Candidatus Paceibacterota bacterium]